MGEKTDKEAFFGVATVREACSNGGRPGMYAPRVVPRGEGGGGVSRVDCELFDVVRYQLPYI